MDKHLEVDANTVVQVLRDRLGELEWELALARTQLKQAQAQIADLMSGKAVK